MGSFKGWGLEAVEPDIRLDVCGRRWPLLWVRTQLVLERMHPGQILELDVANSAALGELPGWASERGCNLLKVEAPDSEFGFRVWLERGA